MDHMAGPSSTTPEREAQDVDREVVRRMSA
jgi:hypothetical protein